MSLANGTVIGTIKGEFVSNNVGIQQDQWMNTQDSAKRQALEALEQSGLSQQVRYTITFNEAVNNLRDVSFSIGVTNELTHYLKRVDTETVTRKLHTAQKTIAEDTVNRVSMAVVKRISTFSYLSGGGSTILNTDRGLVGDHLQLNAQVGNEQRLPTKGDKLRVRIPDDSSIRLIPQKVGAEFSMPRSQVFSGEGNELTANGYLITPEAKPHPILFRIVESTDKVFTIEVLNDTVTNSPTPTTRGFGVYRNGDEPSAKAPFIIANPSKVDVANKSLTNVKFIHEYVGKDGAVLKSVPENGRIAIRGLDLTGTGVVIPKANVSVSVVSTDGARLKEPSNFFTEAKTAGTAYSIPTPVIEGYELDRVEGAPQNGVVANNDQTVTFIMRPTIKNTNVTVSIVDEAGKTIRPTKTVFTEAKPEGTQYSVRKPRIAGYRFVRAEGELAGTLGKTDKTVKLVYKADSSVVAGTDPDTIEERKERVVPIPFETETRDNPELWQGEERVINPGAEGSKTITTTRQLDENQQPVGDPVVTENVTKQPVKRVIERGTKNPAGTETVTTEKPKPFKTETRDNPDLYEGEERVVTEGKDGVTTVTTVYKTNKGKRTGDNPTVTEKEKQPPVNRIVERGTKDPNGIDTVKEHEDVVYKTEYRDNPELYEGEIRVIQEGELGANVITKQYKTKKGKRTDEEPVVTKTTEKEPKNRIIERGTKPVAGVDRVVEDKEVPFKLVVKDNPELTEGEERFVTEGIPGLVKKTTVYKTEKGKRVGDPTVTETVVKEPIDRVVEKGTKPKTPKQTDADKNNPKGKDQTVFVGEKPEPKNSVENYNDLPEGTTVKWEKDPDTATPGQKPSVLLFEYPDGSIERVSVIVTAIPKPEPKDQTVFVGETPKAEGSIGNYPQLPEGTRVSWLVPPKTDKPGVVDGVVLIEHPDGRRIEVSVRVTVVEKEKEKQPPQQEQNNNGENGNNNKDKVSEKSDNSDNSDKDSNKDKPIPQGKDQTVKVGENPLVQNSIINHNELPKGTKLSWEKTPDTTKPGVIEAVVLVEYPDGTSERVTVRVTVVDDSDKGKEKDNHENDNKTNPDTSTNTNNNQTPDKKELNENKQPYRKESIKTGVGSVDQTAAGVALTATALALSAFALRKRKQQ